MESTAIAI